MNFEEVSNNVYKVTLTDYFGRQGETTNTDLEEAITTVETYAFDIEMQTSENWKKFLYDACIIKLGDKKIIEKQYKDEAFGSWDILLKANRILLDGKDFTFCVQVYKEGWVDTTTIKLSALTFNDFVSAINRLR